MSQDGAQGRRLAGQHRMVPAAGRRGRAVTLSVVGLVLLLVLALVGFGVFQYFSLSLGIKRSDILGNIKGPKVPVGKGARIGDTNILIMGLDSRLDENGNPLPAAIYNALHAGDQSNGGLNANVLMLLHVPGGGVRRPRSRSLVTTTCTWRAAPMVNARARSSRRMGWRSTRSPAGLSLKRL